MELLADGKTLLVSSRWARKLSFIDVENAQGGAPGRRGPLAARRVDAGPCASAVGAGAIAAALAAAAGPGRRRGGLRQAAVPDLRHRPHGRGAAGGRGAGGSRCKVTFFLANERTQTGGSSLDDQLGALVACTCRRGPCLRLAHLGPRQLAGRHCPRPACASRPSHGAARRQAARAGRGRLLRRTGAPGAPLPGHDRPAHGGGLSRAGGKTSPALLAAARGCGWTHVGWAPAGFLGDELPSERSPTRSAAGPGAARHPQPATSCWRTWASGRAATPGRRRCWSP
jgi:peptidoglycan-N-acetylmuramic acid deacetylase